MSSSNTNEFAAWNRPGAAEAGQGRPKDGEDGPGENVKVILLVILCILAFVAITGGVIVGGKRYFDNQRALEQQRLHEQQYHSTGAGADDLATIGAPTMTFEQADDMKKLLAEAKKKEEEEEQRKKEEAGEAKTGPEKKKD